MSSSSPEHRRSRRMNTHGAAVLQRGDERDDGNSRRLGGDRSRGEDSNHRRRLAPRPTVDSIRKKLEMPANSRGGAYIRYTIKFAEFVSLKKDIKNTALFWRSKLIEERLWYTQ